MDTNNAHHTPPSSALESLRDQHNHHVATCHIQQSNWSGHYYTRDKFISQSVKCTTLYTTCQQFYLHNVFLQITLVYPFYQLSFSVEEGISEYSTDQRPQTIPCCHQALSFLTQCCFVFICFCTTLLFSYLCIVLVSCTCPFEKHICRPSLLCNPCLLTIIIIIIIIMSTQLDFVLSLAFKLRSKRWQTI